MAGSPAHPTPRVNTLIDLAAQLRRDEAQPLDVLRRRDRVIGQQLTFDDTQTQHLPPAQRAGLVTAWLGALTHDPSEAAAPSAATPRDAMKIVGIIAVVLGLLLGYGAAMGLFYYDGSTPVNVVRVLAVFVGLQGLTLILFWIATLPGGVPGASALRAISPARLAMGAARLLPGASGEAVTQMMGRGGAHQRVYGRVQKWQLLTWSQSLALAFNLAAVCGALQLIVFSDLGFGWSTTLQVDPAAMHRITSAVSWPWSGLWEPAVPDAKLVAATQTYRAENFEAIVTAEDSATWWPFLVTAMVCYGVLPRWATLLWSQWRLRRAVVRAVSLTPGVDRVLDRLSAQVVETRGIEHEASVDEKQAATSLETPATRAGCVICWAEAPGGEGGLHAGGGRSLEEDRQTIAAATLTEGALRLRVKAWEPPVLEFLDFVKDLRAAVGDGRAIEVQPVGDGHRSVWQKKLAGVGDPWLRMVSDIEEGAAS